MRAPEPTVEPAEVPTLHIRLSLTGNPPGLMHGLGGARSGIAAPSLATAASRLRTSSAGAGGPAGLKPLLARMIGARAADDVDKGWHTLATALRPLF